MSALGTTRMRLERLADERAKTGEKIEDLLAMAEDEKRDLADVEQQQLTRHRERYAELEGEIIELAADIERTEGSRDVSKLVRRSEDEGGTIKVGSGDRDPDMYRSYAQYARDEMIVRYPVIAERAAGDGNARAVVEQARERLERAPVNTLSSNIPGLIPPRHIAQIMDIINMSRPVTQVGRRVDLDRGSLTYPKIAQRPEVLLQSAEKTEGGTANMQVTLETLTAQTYIGGGDISWQAINWSSPDSLQLWFDLAAEAYARATEGAACEALESAAGIGTVGTASGRLGTAGTENFAAWRAAAIAGISAVYTATGGRARTDTLFLSSGRFFQLAGLGTDQTLQVSSVGNLDIGSMTGTWAGLRVVGSYGFDQDTAIVGDASALIVAETPGAPVQLRVVEPSIGGMEVGVIGAFKAVVFDANRFYHLGTHL
jgi:HK97 family phage major capsid protein